MKDKKRISKIIEEVKKVWLRFPNLRLGQLIINAIENEKVQPDLYYIEDEKMIEVLKDYYKEKS